MSARLQNFDLYAPNPLISEVMSDGFIGFIVIGSILAEGE